MSDQFIGGLREIIERLNNIADQFTNQATMNRLGAAGERIIQDRTRSGMDISGQTFIEYSAGHAARRAKLNLPVDHVNLMMDDTQGMLKTLDYDVSNNFDRVDLGFTDPEKERIAKYHNITGAGKGRVIRQFFGFSDQDKDKLFNLFADELSKLIIKELV